MTFQPRQPLAPNQETGYLESDRDYVLNNVELACVLLDSHRQMVETLKALSTHDSELVAKLAHKAIPPELRVVPEVSEGAVAMQQAEGPTGDVEPTLARGQIKGWDGGGGNDEALQYRLCGTEDGICLQLWRQGQAASGMEIWAEQSAGIPAAHVRSLGVDEVGVSLYGGTAGMTQLRIDERSRVEVVEDHWMPTMHKTAASEVG